MQSGTQLAHYEIVSPLGKGGMGEVWRAKDTKLGREVAIKTLPPEFAQDADRLARFEREAKLLASLNHPNIAAIYGLEEHEGSRFLVLELVEGDTLADRLKRGAIPVEESLKLALQIAEALEAAHEKGVIHRDLKPANIKVTPDGKVKVLDFGLAKAFAGKEADVNLSNSPTLSMQATQAGIILGTPAYMSPEQAQGGSIDKRTDIWAFGCVLYEMLTQRAPFRRSTAAATIAAILEREPEWDLLGAAVPHVIRRLLRRCLEKDTMHRVRDIGDVRIEIDDALREYSAERVGPDHSSAVLDRHQRGSRAAWAITGVAIVALVLTLLWTRQNVPRDEPSREPIRFNFTASAGNELDAGSRPEPSPDGHQIVYVVRESSGATALWVRSLDEEPRRIAETEDAQAPFWSPDGESLGFFANGSLKKVVLAGGPVQDIAPAPGGFTQGTWGSSGDIVFAPANRSALMWVPAGGGTAPRPVTTLNDELQENSHRFPSFLPNGRQFLFTARSSFRENTAIYVGSLDSDEITRVLTAQSNAVYVPPGYILFARDGTLMAQRFDPDALELTGDAVPVAGAIDHNLASAHARFSASADGSVLAFNSLQANHLAWFDRNGSELERLSPDGDYQNLVLSPDGNRLMIEIPDSETGNRDLWLVDLPDGLPTRSRWTTNPANDWRAVWRPDGAYVAFSSDRTTPSSIFLKPVDGGEEEFLTTETGGVSPWNWSPDGQFLAYAVSLSPSQDVWLWSFFGDPSPRSFLASEFHEGNPKFSPDSNWIAYTSDRAGTNDIHLVSLDQTVQRTISIGGGDNAAWRSDGRELFFMAPNGDLMAVEVTLGVQPRIGTPSLLFQACTNAPLRYAADPSGERFLFVCPPDNAETGSITVLIEWAEMVNWPTGEGPR